MASSTLKALLVQRRELDLLIKIKEEESKTRRSYTAEYKLQCVARLVSGETLATVSKSEGIAFSVLSNWKRQALASLRDQRRVAA